MTKIVGSYCLWDSIKPKTFMDAVQLISQGTFQYVTISCGSLLPHTRNQALVDIFNNCKDFTHVCMVDGDMGDVTPEVIAKLLEADKDLITPTMSRRVPPFSPAMAKENYPELFKELEKPLADRKPIPVLSTGFGCALIKKSVLEAMMERTVGTGVVWFPSDRRPRDSFASDVQKELEVLSVREWKSPEIEEMLKEAYSEGVKMGVSAPIGATLLGEDIEFCFRMKVKGFQPWVHTGVYISHLGDQSYSIKDYIDFCNLEGQVQSRPELSKVSVWDVQEKKKMEIVYGE